MQSFEMITVIREKILNHLVSDNHSLSVRRSPPFGATRAPPKKAPYCRLLTM